MSIRLGDPWDDRMCASYDNWKTREPDYGYEDEYEPECWHEDYSIEWDGLATCERCGHSWEATAAQYEAQRRAEEAYAEHCRREERRERLERWFGWMCFWRRWKRKPEAAEIDDEIPF